MDAPQTHTPAEATGRYFARFAHSDSAIWGPFGAIYRLLPRGEKGPTCTSMLLLGLGQRGGDPQGSGEDKGKGLLKARRGGVPSKPAHLGASGGQDPPHTPGGCWPQAAQCYLPPQSFTGGQMGSGQCLLRIQVVTSATAQKHSGPSSKKGVASDPKCRAWD